MPKRSVVVGANSGGIGVDVRGILANYDIIDFPRVYEAAHGLMAGENGVFLDIVCRGPKRRDIPAHVVFINARIEADGEIRLYAPNLNDTYGQEALPTSGMLAGATCELRALTKPGISNLSADMSRMMRACGKISSAADDCPSLSLV